VLDFHSPRWEPKSSGILYQSLEEPDFVQYRLAAFAFKHLQRVLGQAEPVAELHLRDRYFHLSRAYLFERLDAFVLALWRESGVARMPSLGDKLEDMAGNRPAKSAEMLEITPSPAYVYLPKTEVGELRRRIERAPLDFEDAPESDWKRRLHYFVDVGDANEEKQAGYAFFGKGVTVSKSALYPNGRSLKDAGRVIQGSETYTVPLKDLGENDLILWRRVDYSEGSSPKGGQKCQVSVDEQAVGVWSVPGRDRERHWRDACFLVPNRFLAGKTSVKVNLLAVEGPFTTFDFAAGLKRPGTLYLSDIQPLTDSEGWVGLARPDASFLHSPVSIRGTEYGKGMGVHAPSALVYGLSGQFREFRFHPGIDDVTEGKGSVCFKVFVDGRLAYDSKRADAFAKLEPQVVDVGRAETLRLVVEDGADGKENDIADWGDARLTH
jgi:hypothetical protein